MEYSVNLNMFQGPFELLFHLIEIHEIDIYDIPISEITEQYLNYLNRMRQFNMNITSEFILMAATLIEIKSQMLLPSKSKDDDPRTELVNQLLEYKLFKDATVKLKEYEAESAFYYSKPKEELMFAPENNRVEQLVLNEMNIYELYNIFMKLMKNQDLKLENEKNHRVYRESFSVKDCVDDLMVRLKKSGRISLFNTISEYSRITREYIITMFLAVLELSKMQGMEIKQYGTFSDILINYRVIGEEIA